ncbi:MAG: hypothetical protein ACRDTM_01740 [Micromonosporaceae bacterium]
MPWTWRYLDADGESAAGPVEVFASQSDAESWLGQEYGQLAESGVVKVTLLEDDRVEYDMSLLPVD